MTHFDHQIYRALTERAQLMTDADLATLLADPEVSSAGRRVLKAEVARRAERKGNAQGSPSRPPAAREGPG